MGPIYARDFDGAKRRKTLTTLALGMWGLLIVLRSTNLYGEVLPFEIQDTAVQSVMSFINYTKYPPSLDYVLFTLGAAFLILVGLDKVNNQYSKVIENFGSAPMFFYILHLAVLLVLYRIAINVWGPNHGDMFAFDDVWQIWAGAVVLGVTLYFPTKAFSAFKKKSGNPLIKYF